MGVQLNGLPSYDTQVRRPRVGLWTADLRVDTLDGIAVGSVVTVTVGSRSLRGHLLRGETFAGAFQARVVGGLGGMARNPQARFYNGVTVGLVLTDIFRDVGEDLSASSDLSVLNTSMGSWATTSDRTAGDMVARLLAAASPGAAWRAMDDGTIWVGRETWPDSGVSDDTFVVVERRGEDASLRASVLEPELEPGTTYKGRRVSLVQHDVPHQGDLETRAWFEDDVVSQVGRARAAFEAMVQATPERFSYLGRWSARVVAQSGRTVHVVPDDARAPDMGDVTLLGSAGESVDGVVGGHVLVGWLGGDPRMAYATDFDGDETVGEKVIGALQLYLGAKTGAFPVLLLDPPTIAWLAAVGTGSGAGPIPQTSTSLIVRAK